MTSRVLFRAKSLLESGTAAGPVMGLDTSSPIASLAIVSNGKVTAEVTRSASTHGAELPAAVEELLQQAGLRFDDLKGIAIGLGPGSFTGLRIGLSYVKGLLMALRCLVAGVPTFDCLALAAAERAVDAPEGSVICPLVDARKGEVYAALYRVVPDGVEKISEAFVLTLEKLVLQVPSGVILAGDLKAHAAFELLSQRGIRSTVLQESALNSRGRYVAAIGAKRFSSQEADSPAALEPLYVRTAEATFKPGAAPRGAAGKESLWSTETKSSSNNF